MAADQLAKLLGEGEDEVEVADRKDLFPAPFDPLRRVPAPAFGTVAILAGVVGVVELSALIALEHMASEGFGATLQDIVQGLGMARGHPLFKLLEVLRTMEPEDPGKLRHGGRLPLDHRSFISKFTVVWRRSTLFCVRWV